jgi:hypothetical protein
LQHTERSLNVLSPCFLSLSKNRLLPPFWLDGLYKCYLIRIDATGKIIPYNIVMPINNVVSSRSISTSKPSK